jgi:hypothetical protein
MPDYSVNPIESLHEGLRKAENFALLVESSPKLSVTYVLYCIQASFV